MKTKQRLFRGPGLGCRGAGGAGRPWRRSPRRRPPKATTPRGSWRSRRARRGRRRLRQPGFVQVRRIQRPVQQGLFGIFNLDVRGGGSNDSGDATRWRIDRHRSRARDARRIRRVRAAGQVPAQFRLRRAAAKPLGHLPDALSRRRLRHADAAVELDQADRAAGQRTAMNFRALSPATGLAPSNVSGVVTPPTPAQQATVRQHHRHGPSGLQQRRPRHQAQDDQRRIQLQHRFATGNSRSAHSTRRRTVSSRWAR